jgi:hypothetical protein
LNTNQTATYKFSQEKRKEKERTEQNRKEKGARKESE